MNTGELIRLRIWAFQSEKFINPVRGEPFEVQVNPESFSITYNINYGGTQEKGTSSFNPKWEKNPPRKLSFDIILDNTGAIPGKNERVAVLINRLDSTLFKPHSKGHRPNYLEIEWGALIFDCVLDNMTVAYKLFAPDGEPLRATVNVSFIEVIRKELHIRALNANSPDVTHAFTVKDGDSLPLLAEKVYGDGAYYIAVAQANKLIQFRNLKAGNSLVFPPIKKQDA